MKPSHKGSLFPSAFQQWFPRIRNFLQARLSASGYLGLHLTVGAVLIVAGVWLFGAIAEDVVEGDPIVALDQRIAVQLNTGATPGLVAAMLKVTAFGSAPVVSAVALAVALVLAWRRSWAQLVFLSAALGGGMLLNLLLKTLFGRHRPVLAHPFQTIDGYSFPSGHSTAATLLYGALAVLGVISWRWWGGRALIIFAATLLIVAVCFSRVYLGVHFFSDVLGAFTISLAWLALSFTAVDTLRRRRSLHATASDRAAS